MRKKYKVTNRSGIRISKNLIVLCGDKNTGKTKTLTALTKKGKLVGTILATFSKGRDWIAIYRIKNKNVGVVTIGDKAEYIERGFFELENQIKKSKIKLDTIVIAIHPRQVVYAIDRYGFVTANVVTKVVDTNADNTLCLNEILKLI